MRLNEAQLINPQDTNKNMVAGNKIIREWLEYGRVIYSDGNKVVIEGKEEFLIKYEDVIIHVTRDRISVLRDKWYVSTAPHYRGAAKKIALRIMTELPISVSRYIIARLPLLAPLLATVK